MESNAGGHHASYRMRNENAIESGQGVCSDALDVSALFKAWKWQGHATDSALRCPDAERGILTSKGTTTLRAAVPFCEAGLFQTRQELTKSRSFLREGLGEIVHHADSPFVRVFDVLLRELSRPSSGENTVNCSAVRS